MSSIIFPLFPSQQAHYHYLKENKKGIPPDMQTEATNLMTQETATYQIFTSEHMVMQREMGRTIETEVFNCISVRILQQNLVSTGR